MEKFTYRAIKNKKLESGEMEARNEEEVSGKLSEKGFEILSIRLKEESAGKVFSKKGKNSFFKKLQKVKKVEKVFFYKNFYTMLKAGLPVTEIIDLLRESIKNPRMEEILGKLKYDIESGNYISASLEIHPDVFGTSEIAMIRAGEIGGTLPQSFEGLFEDAESERKLQSDIKGAMMYPMIVLTILLGVTLLLLIFVLPQLTGFFDQANLEVPVTTRIVMGLSAFLKKNFIYILIALIGIFVGIRVGTKRSKKFKEIVDKLILKIPMLGMQFKYFFIHKFARMLGLLLKSGVPILQSLEIVEKSLTHTGYARSIKYIHSQVKVGGKLSDLISEFDKLYPPFVGRMLKVGDRTGNTSEALENVSDYYQQELLRTLSNLSSLIEPILMVFLGVGVAFIAITVLIPMYKIVSGINQMQK